MKTITWFLYNVQNLLRVKCQQRSDQLMTDRKFYLQTFFRINTISFSSKADYNRIIQLLRRKILEIITVVPAALAK